MKRVLLASVMQEVCHFVDSRTDLDAFRRFYVLYGSEVIDKLQHEGMEITGVVKAAGEEGVELVPVLAAYGGTGGPVTNEAYGLFRESILEGARQHAQEVDGAMLVLHGAMATEDLDDPEGDLLAELHGILGPDKPIVCSLDLHAHITGRMVRNATALVGYHTWPHVDFADTGYRAMKLLGRTLRGEIHPSMAHRKRPMIAGPESHNTNQGPMVEIMGRVLASEKLPGMLSTSIFPVQPFMDVPDLGWCTVAVSNGDPALARAQAEEIAGLAWERRRSFLVKNTPIEEALRLARETEGGPVVLADGSDSTSAGAEGDSTCLLQGLLDYPVPGQSLLTITDPEAVARCVVAGVRSEVSLPVGGKLSPSFFQPVQVSGTVRTISDGLYQMKHPRLPADRGRTVVLQVGEIFLVLSEKGVFTWDEECYRTVGLFPREAKVVQVKTAGGFRPIYEPFAKRIVWLDVPGPADSNVARLPFRRVTRPLYPLDEI